MIQYLKNITLSRNMTIFSVVPILLISLSVITADEDSGLTPFGQDVKKDVGEDLYKKLFSIEDPQNLGQAFYIGTEAYIKESGLDTSKVSTNYPELFKKLGSKLAGKITRKSLFVGYTNGLSKTLTDTGRLTPQTVGQLAHLYSHLLKEAAKKLKNDSVLSTKPAVSGTNGKFLRELGITSTKDLEQLLKNLVEEGNKIK